MQFLAPEYLFGLLLVSIPILIHLLNFQRRRRIAFSNVAMLQEVKSSASNLQHLRHWLVLLLRVLFVVFLVLAFARPYLPQAGKNGQQAPRQVGIYLDNSYSMQNGQGSLPLLEVGRQRIGQIAALFPSGTRFQLLDNGFSANSLFPLSASELEQRAAQTPYANATRTLSQVQLKQQQTPGQRQLFWLSDFQKSTIGPLEALQLDSATQYYFMPIPASTAHNLYIDTLWTETPFIRDNEHSVLKAVVRNGGQEDVAQKPLRLFIDGKQVGSTSLSLPAGERQEITLTFSATTPGQKACRLSVEDYPLSFDNDYHFVLQVAPKVHIALISDNPEPYVKQVYASEPFFSLKTFPSSAVDYAALEEADLIVLDQPRLTDATLGQALQTALQRGASLTIFPPAQAEGLQQMLPPLGLGLQAHKPSEGEEPQELQVPQVQGGFFADIFEKAPDNMNMPKGISLAGWQAVARPLLSLRNGQPFMSEMRSGPGHLYLFSAPLDMRYSTLPRHALFVPIMYKIALDSKHKGQRLAYSFQDVLAELPVEGLQKDDIFALEKEGTSLIPLQRVVGGNLQISIPKTGMEAGTYVLRNTRSKQAAGLLAFNYGKEESQLDRYSADELRELLGDRPNVSVLEAVANDNFAQEFREQHVARQLWRWFLLLAIVCLLAETALLRMRQAETAA